MNLNGLFQYNNSHHTGSQGTEAVRQGSTASSSNTAGQAASSLNSGQTIRGEVVARSGNEVQIMTDNGTMINARLDRDVQVPLGQTMTFEVKNNSGVQVALRPLYENLAQDGNVMKALDAARLPATNELMRMVSAMMKQGMSIDKNALMDMSRLVMANPKANPETVVMLKHLQLPVTPENIQQFENYQRYEHQLLHHVTDLLAELPKTYQSLMSGGQGSAAVDLYTQVLQLFTGTQSGGEGSVAVTGQNVFADIVGNGTQANGEQALPQGAANAQEALVQAEGRMAESLRNLMDTAILQKTPEGGGEQARPGAVLQDNQLLGLLDAGGRSQLAGMLGKLGLGEGQLAQVLDGSMSSGQLLQEVRQLLEASGSLPDKAGMQELLGSKEFNQVLQKEILNQWLLRPEDVGTKQKLEDYYGKLREQTARLAEALNQVAKDTPLAKSMNTMQNNMDFMNQINQAFHYIQLPLKMSGGEAHGDLYVYTNRKATAKEDGSVSALLHLDMEHLGTMDIHVRMQEKNVSTKFYLADEGIIDFMAENIHILNERLTKRGYSLDAQMLPAEDGGEEKTNVMEAITAQENKVTLLAQYSFDARA